MLINDFLKETMEKGEYVDIYRDNFNTNTIFGNIISLGDKLLAINEFNNNGLSEGFCFIYISDITRISYGGYEQQAIKISIEENGNSITDKRKMNLENKNFIDIIIEYFPDHVISIATEGLDDGVLYMGKYIASDKEFLKINSYGTYQGPDYSELLIKIENITKISVNSIYSKNLETVFKNKATVLQNKII